MAPARKHVHRAVRFLGFLAAGLIGLVVLVLVLLQFRPVRESVLDFALGRVVAALPGDLTVGEAFWPALGDVELLEIDWRVGESELVRADRVRVSADLGELLKRDLVIHDLSLDRVSVNIPAVLGAVEFGKEESRKPQPEKGESGLRFPRPGALRGLPSVAVEAFNLSGKSIMLPDSSVIDTVAVRGNLDARPGQGPSLALEHLVAVSEGESWSIDQTDLRMRPGGEIGGYSEGKLGEGWPFRIDLEGTLEGRFDLTLLLGEEKEFSEPFGIRITGDLGLSGSRIETVEFAAEVSIPAVEELARLPFLDKALAGAPLLGPTRLTANGMLGLEPEFSAEAAVIVHPSDWVRRGEARFQYRESTMEVDTLGLELPDLVLKASGRFGEEIAVRAGASVTGVTWLGILGVELPADSLALQLEASISGPVSAPAASARLSGGMVLSGTAIENLDLRVEAPGIPDQQIQVLLTARILETWARIALDLSMGEVIEVVSSPLMLTSKEPAGQGVGKRRSRVAFDPETRNLSVRDFEILGDLGEVALGASIRDLSSGEATVAARWMTPPRILDQLLAPGTVDSMAASWTDQGPFTMDVRVNLSEAKGARLIDVDGDLVLPGPAALSKLLPEGAPVDSLGPFRSEIELALRMDDDGFSYNAVWDPSRTDWIDSAQFLVQGGAGRLRIQESNLETMGVRLSVDGGQESGAWDLAGRLEVSSVEAIRLFAPSVGPLATATLQADWSFKGTPQAPDLAASIQGEMLTDILAVERIDGDVLWNQEGLSARLALPRGMRIPVMLDSLTVTYRSENEGMDPFPGILKLDASGSQIQVAQILEIDRDPDWAVQVDSLWVAIPEGDLGTQRPFRVRLLGENQAVMVEGLALSGSLGRVTANVYADPDSNDIEADAYLIVPQEPKVRFPMPGLWPEVVELDVRSQEGGSVVANLVAMGLEMAGRADMDARMNLRADRELTEVELLVEDSNTRYAEVDLSIPARLDVYPPSWVPADGSLAGTVSFTSLQLAWDRLVPGATPGQTLVLGGQAEIGGTVDKPTMQSSFTAQLPSNPARPDYVLNLDAQLERSAGTDSAAGSQGLFANVRLDRGPATVMKGTLAFQMVSGSDVGSDSSRTVELTIESEPLPLKEFNSLIPTDYTMKGLIALNFRAQGRPEDPSIEGSLVASNLDVAAASGGNAAGEADVRFSGTGLRPRVRGRIDVIGGVIPIPENRRTLLPDEGQAVLWEAEGLPGLTAMPEDTLSVQDKASPKVEPDIDVTVRVPSSLWIRGRQMDIELAGDLRVEYREEAPVITGTLKTRGGHMTLIGRTFTPERGEVTFYGDDEFNPSLDIRLTSRVEQYEIIVTITQTVQEPKLELSSIPDLDQSDIMSVLTFGKPANQLDGDQLALAAQRAAAMAAMYGSSEIGNALADPLGLDMLAYNPSGREGKSSIVAGKYLNRRALLKYEQALESGAGFFVSLEYSLDDWIKNMKIETLVGTRQSGAEIFWSRDY